MKSYDEMTYHPTSERLVEVLSQKIQQNPNPRFFRVLVAYYWSVLAAQMRATITTQAVRGEIPVNLYALSLSTSGTGKGYSTNIMENEVIHKFRSNFLENTFPVLAENNLPKLAIKRAARKASDPDDELKYVQKEFDDLGSLVFSFDSATSPAVKQLRHKLLMADAGSMNLQIDEIGSNLIGNIEVLNTFLELFDVGKVKNKLIKNTSDSKRNEEIIGTTPTNMLLFGTPSKLLDGDKIEGELYSMLETGYARRCFFAYTRSMSKKQQLTPRQVLDMLNNQDSNEFLEELSHQLEQLADIANVNRKLVMDEAVSLLLIEYKLECERIAANLSEHEAVKAAEISHRYFKALKLAGAYAFIDASPEITEDHLYSAIKMAEDSGADFNDILTRDKPYAKLAKYLAVAPGEVTQADLSDALPFYKGSASARADMMSYAIAWGYRNNIIIKKSFSDSIEFFRGEALEATNLDKMIVSWSTHEAYRYKNELAPWDKLTKLTQTAGLHWVAHHLAGGNDVDENGVSQGHRTEDTSIAGFNMVVIDVDGGVTIDFVKKLMSKYTYLLYTTKRHQTIDPATGLNHGDRFRLVLPTNFLVKLDSRDYKEFMENIYAWLPFKVDDTTGQRSRKWMSHNGHFEYNEGELFDALPFIPKTSKNEERKKLLNNQQSMDNLERWFVNNIGDGNRNNMLHRYGRILVDGGLTLDQVERKILDLNNKLIDKLDETEIYTTVMKSVTKAYAQQP